MSKIYIRQLLEQDWQDAKSIRLRALQDSESAYLSSYEREAQHSEARWRSLLTDESSAVFGLYDTNKIVGLTAVFTWNGDTTGKTAVCSMSFIEEDYRGKGYSKLLFEARLAWVRSQNSFTKVRTSYREGNEASKRANQAFGFKYINKKLIEWPDGLREFEYNYELDLRK